MSASGAGGSALPVLHVLGCGRAARVIARWLFEANQVSVGRVVNRSVESARRAVAFVGDGRAGSASDPPPASGWLLVGLPDRELLAMSPRLQGWLARLSHQASGQRIGREAEDPLDCVFHLSGALDADVLAPCRLPAASLHPVRAFASPEAALAAMPGTPCVAEGDRRALDCLRPAIVAAGGDWLELDSTDKARYHAATVVASNGLVALTHLARSLADSARLEPAQAGRLLDHLQRGTLDNLRASPAAEALTGPIERADPMACERLLRAVDESGQDRSGLFRALGRATLELAVRKRGERVEDDALAALFSARPASRPD